MAKKINPRELLEQVLRLIEKDVEQIESMQGKLDGEVAATLVRYSDALLKITKDSDGQAEAEREKVANLSMDELRERARRFVDAKK